MRKLTPMTREAWIAYTGTEKNFDQYLDGIRVLNRDRFIFPAIFGSWTLIWSVMAYLVATA